MHVTQLGAKAFTNKTGRYLNKLREWSSFRIRDQEYKYYQLTSAFNTKIYHESNVRTASNSRGVPVLPA